MNIIFKFLNSLLNLIFTYTGDWGFAIVLLTVAVRIILSPMSFKQKRSMQQQQKLAANIEEIKEKYKDNKAKLDEEIMKHSVQSVKGVFGCLVTLIQLPVLFGMWNVINKMPAQVGTLLIPWVSSIKLSDSYFIVPLIYILVSLAPSLFSYIPFLEIEGQAKMSKANVLIMVVSSLLIAKTAPIAIGLYLITTSIFTFLEELCFRIYMRKYKIA